MPGNTTASRLVVGSVIGAELVEDLMARAQAALEIKELDDVEEGLYHEMMAAEEILKSLSDVYERMKADPAKYDPTSFTLNLATAHEAVVTANHCAKEATSEWQKADSELKAASHRAAKAADARSRKEIKKDGVDMCDD